MIDKEKTGSRITVVLGSSGALPYLPGRRGYANQPGCTQNLGGFSPFCTIHPAQFRGSLHN
jgi:hypothetical protein